MAQKLEDSETTGAIISFFADNGMFTSAERHGETADILARDDEDGEKLAAGIRMAVAKKVLHPTPVEALTLIPVLGKSADAVDAIIASSRTRRSAGAS